jgi:DNA-binding PadR family transcriptional regulator
VVKREFENSPSVSWSASAGSIYPLVKKLSGAGLLEIQKQRWGARQKALVSISDTGRDALQSWAESVPEGIAQPSPDPIRTRSFYLDVLEEERRFRFLDQAEAATQRAIEELRCAIASLPDTEPEYESLAAAGAVFQLKARLRWIRYLRRAAEGPSRV